MNTTPRPFIVTGALGYSGRYIAERLLAQGHRVRTLTGSPDRPNPFGDRIEIRPFHFDDRTHLIESLRGADVLINTYWVRFNAPGFTFAEAVENSLKLFDAAREAGIGRIVHTSITHPSEDSPFEYFRGKARLERAIRESGLSHAILRPAVFFGGHDVLINNIAWILRRFPLFGVFGHGRYRIQPIHVADYARLAVQQAGETENLTIDAVGPETFTYRALVRLIGEAIGCRRPVFSIPPWVGFTVAQIVGRLVGDVLITREEIGGLMAGLLATDSAPAGATRLSAWAREHAETLGRQYASELARRRK